MATLKDTLSPEEYKAHRSAIEKKSYEKHKEKNKPNEAIAREKIKEKLRIYAIKYYYENRDKYLVENMTEDQKIKRREQAKKSTIKNKERIKVYQQKYAILNPDKAKEANRRHYIANKEKINKASSEYAKKNPEKVKAASKKCYEKNKKEYKEKSTLRQQANPKQAAIYSNNWRLRNLEKNAEASRNRRARKLLAEGTHTAQDIKDLYTAQKGRCAYCKVKVGKSYHVDHIQPLAKGGGNGKDNLQICCPTCNMRKKAKDPIDFARELGFLL